MSIALATRKIAEYSGKIEQLNARMEVLEKDALDSVSDPAKKAEVMKELTQVKTWLGMLKDFLEGWKDVIKTFLGHLKLFNDLAKGAQ